MPDLYTSKEQFEGLDFKRYNYEPLNADDTVDVYTGKMVDAKDDDGNETKKFETEEKPLLEAKDIDTGPFQAAKVPYEWQYVIPGTNEKHSVTAGGYAVIYTDSDGNEKVRGVNEARFNRDFYLAKKK